MLTVAHRLQTIINSDKVLVLGDGKKLEFGDPAKLRNEPRSLFRRLLNRMQDSNH